VTTLIAFGGAGPVHAWGLARKLGSPRFIVPPNAGVGSALGFFTAPRAFDLTRSHKVGLQEADFSEIESVFRALEAEAARTLESSGSADEIVFERSVDVRFVGQGSETNIPVPGGDFAKVPRDEIRRRFDETYEKLYGRTYPSPVEFIHFKVRARLPERLLRLPRLEGSGKRLEDARKGTRDAYAPARGGFTPHAVYDRYALFPGAEIKGPAIVEERESTVVVGEGGKVRVDEYGFLWVDLEEV
jgi:N-methylhydantoinase A